MERWAHVEQHLLRTEPLWDTEIMSYLSVEEHIILINHPALHIVVTENLDKKLKVRAFFLSEILNAFKSQTNRFGKQNILSEACGSSTLVGTISH